MATHSFGEFWLEEMNITLDTANSSGYDVAKMVKGHVKAQNDWIVYSPDNYIVANYSIQISDEHPKFNLLMWMEVYVVKSSFSTFVGGVEKSIECAANKSYNVHGNLSIPLSEVNFTGGNVTLVCHLKAVIYSKVKFNLSPSKNLTYMIEDRAIVAVEEDENTNTDFLWYLNQIDEYAPSMWKDMPGLESQPSEVQEEWSKEQTLSFFVDINFASMNDDDQENNVTIERSTWYLANFTVIDDLHNLMAGHPVAYVDPDSIVLHTHKEWDARYCEVNCG